MRDPLIVKWPRALSPRNIVTQINNSAVFGPQPIGSSPQSVSSPSAGWRMTYEGVPFNEGNESVYFPILDRIGGFQEPIYISPYRYFTGPVARAGEVSPIYYRFAGGYVFSTGYRFASSISDCVLAADANEGAAEISVTNSSIAPLSPGDWFELDGRSHRLISIQGERWKFWPLLRASYPVGKKIEIADPRVLCYLSTDSQAMASRIIMGRYGDATLEFVEAPW